MSRYSSRNEPNDCKVYVGDLGSNASKQDLEEAFSYYGDLRSVWVARNPPGFAFVEFEDPRDAEDSCRGLDGRNLCGRRIKVEMSSNRPKRKFRAPPPRGRPFHPEDRCYQCGEKGHYARDCRGGGSSRGDSRGESRGDRGSGYSRSRRSFSRSRSRSPVKSRRSESRSRSRTPPRKDRMPSPRRSRSPSPRKSRSHSRSRTPMKNGSRHGSPAP